MLVLKVDYKDYSVHIFQTDDHYVCYILRGQFSFLVTQFTDESGLWPTRRFACKDEALIHAKTYIDTDNFNR
jgi:hypothetical protein